MSFAPNLSSAGARTCILRGMCNNNSTQCSSTRLSVIPLAYGFRASCHTFQRTADGDNTARWVGEEYSALALI